MPWVVILKFIAPLAAIVGIDQAWQALFGEALSPEDAKELQREVDRANRERDVQTVLTAQGKEESDKQTKQAVALRTGEMEMEGAQAQAEMTSAAQASMGQLRSGIMTSEGQFDGWSKPFNWETVLNMGR